MTPTDSQLDALLEALDTASRKADSYPPRGLGIWGNAQKRMELRAVVQAWLTEISAEATQR